MNNKKSNKQLSLEWLGGIWILLVMVSFSSIVILNSTFIYRLVDDHYRLPYITGLTREALMENYRQIIVYLQLPWIRELYMPDFIMSETGRIHFEEVKIIFQVLFGIVILSLPALVFAIIKRMKLLPMLNKAANLIFILFGLIAITMLISFERAFLWFHLIFFNNDYWIFSPITDPVILALPAELFMISGIAIIVILFASSILIKFYYYRYYKKRNSNI